MSTWSNRLGRRQIQKRRPYRQFRNESTFVCGTVKKPLGSNVAIAEKTRVLKRISKKDSALHKHMAWLKELEENKKRLEEEKKAEEERKVERMRLLKCDATLTKKQAASASDTDTEDISSVVSAKQQPAWCQTEEGNKKSEELAGHNEEQALLDFVDDLDFEQYTQDLELQTLMRQVKSRIKCLHQERKKDETRLQTCVDSEKAAERAEKVNIQILMDKVPSEDPHIDQIDDTQSIADSVLSTDSTIRSIHSQKSMAALVSEAKRRMDQLKPIEEGEEMPMIPPTCITHTDDDGARLAEKKSVSKLAFTRRNPAL